MVHLISSLKIKTKVLVTALGLATVVAAGSAYSQTSLTLGDTASGGSTAAGGNAAGQLTAANLACIVRPFMPFVRPEDPNDGLPGDAVSANATVAAGTVSNGVVSGSTAADATASGPDADTGQPPFEPGKALGYFIWRDQGAAANTDLVHVRWTIVRDAPEKSHAFTGRISTDGSIENFDRVRLEPQDWARQRGALVTREGNAIVWNARNYGWTDGFDFSVTPAGSAVRLSLEIDGQLAGLDNIYLARDGHHPANNPFIRHWGKDSGGNIPCDPVANPPSACLDILPTPPGCEDSVTRPGNPCAVTAASEATVAAGSAAGSSTVASNLTCTEVPNPEMPRVEPPSCNTVAGGNSLTARAVTANGLTRCDGEATRPTNPSLPVIPNPGCEVSASGTTSAGSNSANGLVRCDDTATPVDPNQPNPPMPHVEDPCDGVASGANSVARCNDSVTRPGTPSIPEQPVTPCAPASGNAAPVDESACAPDRCEANDPRILVYPDRCRASAGEPSAAAAR